MLGVMFEVRLPDASDRLSRPLDVSMFRILVLAKYVWLGLYGCQQAGRQP